MNTLCIIFATFLSVKIIPKQKVHFLVHVAQLAGCHPIPCTRKLPVQFPVKAHAQLLQVPTPVWDGGHAGGSQCFFLSPSPFPSLSKNE